LTSWFAAKAMAVKMHDALRTNLECSAPDAVVVNSLALPGGLVLLREREAERHSKREGKGRGEGGTGIVS